MEPLIRREPEPGILELRSTVPAAPGDVPRTAGGLQVRLALFPEGACAW